MTRQLPGYLRRFGPLVVAILALAGCQSASSTTRRADTGPVVAMRQVAAATTPQQFCGLASRGFETFLGGGTPARCAARLPTVLHTLPHGVLTVHDTRVYGGEYVVDATVRPTFPNPTSYYFVDEHGRWRLHSIGIYKSPEADVSRVGRPH